MSEAASRPSDSLADPPTGRPGVARLFNAFLGVGMMGFGGVLPLARRMLVEQRRWLSPAEFNDLITLCQFLPGGNVINLPVAVGMRFRGPRGAVAALTGLMAGPVTIVVALGSVYARTAGVPLIQHLFIGLGAAAAGMFLATAAKIARALPAVPSAIGVAAICFLAMVVLHLPLPWMMAVLVPVSIALAWRRV